MTPLILISYIFYICCIVQNFNNFGTMLHGISSNQSAKKLWNSCLSIYIMLLWKEGLFYKQVKRVCYILPVIVMQKENYILIHINVFSVERILLNVIIILRWSGLLFLLYTASKCIRKCIRMTYSLDASGYLQSYEMFFISVYLTDCYYNCTRWQRNPEHTRCVLLAPFCNTFTPMNPLQPSCKLLQVLLRVIYTSTYN